METELRDKDSQRDGVTSRIGGEGKLEYETKQAKINEDLKNKKFINLKELSSLLLLIILCIISIIIEIYFKKGSITLIIGLIIIGLYSIRARKHDNIPLGSPEDYYPFFGHLFNVFRRWDDFLDLETSVFLKMGPGKHFCASLPLGRNFIFITDPNTIDTVFRLQFGNADKGPEVKKALYSVFGDGIFASDGELWKKHRSLASKLFTIRSLRDYMYEVFQDTTTTLINKMEELNTQHGYVDLYNLFHRLTLEAFTQIAFGVSLGTIASAPRDSEFATAFERVFQIASFRFFDSSWVIKRFFNIGIEKEFKSHLKIVNEFASKVINERKKQFLNKSAIAQRFDILSLFLNEDPNMNEKELRDISINFLVAARDTTAEALSWLTYLLGQNKEIEKNILKEINEIIPSHIKDNEITYDMVTKCHYLEMCLYESLRIRPSVPHLVRFAKVDIPLPDGHIIRKGDGIVVPVYAMGRLPWIWKNPEVFDPTRFENNNYTPSQYPIFNLPPRLCLGKHVALLEAKICLIRLLRRFTLEPIPNQVVTYVVSITNQMKNGYKVKLIPRENI